MLSDEELTIAQKATASKMTKRRNPTLLWLKTARTSICKDHYAAKAEESQYGFGVSLSCL